MLHGKEKYDWELNSHSCFWSVKPHTDRSIKLEDFNPMAKKRRAINDPEQLKKAFQSSFN